MQGPPDLRVFNATAAVDHGVYDAGLVQHYQQYSNWTSSKLKGVPLELAHYVAHAEEKLKPALASIPGAPRHAPSDLFIRNLAYTAIRFLGCNYHVHRHPIDEAMMLIRRNLQLTAREKRLFLENEEHPLFNHFRAKAVPVAYSDGREGYSKAIPAKDQEAQWAKALLGKNPALLSPPLEENATYDAIAAALPYLTEIDDTNVECRLLELRQKLREITAHKPFFTPEIRQKLLKIIVDDWQQTYFDGKHDDLFDATEQEVRTATGTENILSHPDDEILRTCFGSLFKQDTFSDTDRRSLLDRRFLLEHLASRALEAQNQESIDAVAMHIGAYHTKLDLSLGELGHLGLIFGSQHSEVDISKFRDRYIE